MVLLRQMPAQKEFVTAAELIEAGLPKAILWNNDPQKKVASDIFIVATLQRAYNDFIRGSLPLSSMISDFIEAVKEILIEPVISDCTVIAFDVGILSSGFALRGCRFARTLWIARLDILQGELLLFGPVLQSMADILRSVVAPQFFWFASLFDDPLQSPYKP